MKHEEDGEWACDDLHPREVPTAREARGEGEGTQERKIGSQEVCADGFTF